MAMKLTHLFYYCYALLPSEEFDTENYATQLDWHISGSK